jgi:hypothetical protein
LPRSRSILITPPLGGINNDFARIEQPPKTTVDCLDMFPYGREFRARIASRPGTGSGSATVIGSGDVKLFQQLTYISGVTPTAIMYAVAGSIGAGAGKGRLYTIAAGVVKETVPPATTNTLAATAGTVPNTYAGCVVHRNRLILFGPDHLWAASRVDAYGDWDFARTQSDRAFTSTNVVTSSPGSAMDPIITAIPWTNDLLVMAGDHSLWGVRGDLTFGGRIDLLNNGVGILGPNAWAIDPLNNLWIVGTGGIYKGSGQTFEPVSVGHYTNYFQTLNRSTNTVSCAWDRDRYGLWIFAKSKNALFYNARDGSFWPTTISTTANAAGVFDGNAPADRQVLFAEGSTIKTIDNTAAGSSISGYIYLGPIFPDPSDPNSQWILTETDITLGNIPAGFLAADIATTWTLSAGHSPYQAYASAAETATGTITAANRGAILRSRLRGSCFFLKLANSTSGTFFEFESARLTFKPAGRGRPA